MAWLKSKAVQVFDNLMRCPRCSHTEDTPGCDCTDGDCVCG